MLTEKAIKEIKAHRARADKSNAYTSPSWAVWLCDQLLQLSVTLQEADRQTGVQRKKHIEEMGKVSHLTAELTGARERAERAEHVVVTTGTSHEDLDCCGCEHCEGIRSGLMESGYLTRRNQKPG